MKHETYHCSHVGVGSNVGNFKTTSHELQLNFQYGTTRKPIHNIEIPRYGFSCVPCFLYSL